MFVKRNNNCRSLRDVVENNTGVPVGKFIKKSKEPWIKNLSEAVRIVKSPTSAGHPLVTVVGDYDADGICASLVMAYGLYMAGIPFRVRLPHRFSEGYGLSEKIIDEIKSGIVLTVDNGIAAHTAIKKAKSKGLTVVVTDHHLAARNKDGSPRIPEADVVVNPSIDTESGWHDYCGAAVAYRFVKELLGADVPELKVLASIATVADVMPLYGPNRDLVNEGLELLNSGYAVPGLKRLVDMMNLSHINEEDYGFGIGPVFNASGRLFDDGSETVLKTLMLPSNSEQLENGLEMLLENNQTRKALTESALKAAESEYGGERPAVIFNPEIGEGIIGLVAGKFCEKYQCPTVCFTRSHNGMLKGSGRSIPGIHLKEALDRIKDILAGYGGHEGAAGLSIKESDLGRFTEAFKTACGKIPPYTDDLYYDLDITQAMLGETGKEQKQYAPYGCGNPKPVYRVKLEVKPEGLRITKDGKHLTYWEPGFKFIGFGMADKYRKLLEAHGYPKSLDCVGQITEDWYNERLSYQLQLIDFDFC